MFFFFFSSRRRHTRLQGDWSSDVCSSDLLIEQAPGQESWQAADPAAPLDGLRGEPGLDGGEQGGIEDRLMVSPERLAAIDHLADIEPVAQQMREPAHPEGAPAPDTAVLKLALPGPDAAALKV